MSAEHVCSFCIIFIVTLSLDTLSLFYRQGTKAQFTQISSRARIWTFVLLAPNLCSFLHRSPPLSRFFCSLSHGALLGVSCTRTDSFTAACRHLQEGQLTSDFVNVHCSCSALFQLVKIHSCSPRFYFKHRSVQLPPKQSSSMTPEWVSDCGHSGKATRTSGPSSVSALPTSSSNWPMFQAGLCDLCPPLFPVLAWPCAMHPAGLGVGFPFLEASLSDCTLGAPVVWKAPMWSAQQVWGAHSSGRISWRGSTWGRDIFIGQTWIFLVQAHQFTNTLALQQVIQHISPCFLIWHSR